MCISTVLQWEHWEHGEQAGATLGLQGPRGADRHLRGSSNNSVVSSGEPQVSGFHLILFNMYLTGRRVAVAEVCGKRGGDRKVSEHVHSLKPRKGYWVSLLHQGQKPWGWGLRGRG